MIMANNLEHLTNVWEIAFKVSISPTHFLLLVSYRDHQYSGSPSLKRKAPSIRVRPMFIQDCESTVLFIVLVALAPNQNSKFFHSVPITLINKKRVNPLSSNPTNLQRTVHVRIVHISRANYS